MEEEVVVLLAEAEGTSFVVGNGSAAIIFQSDFRPGHGSSGARTERLLSDRRSLRALRRKRDPPRYPS